MFRTVLVVICFGCAFASPGSTLHEQFNQLEELITKPRRLLFGYNSVGSLVQDMKDQAHAYVADEAAALGIPTSSSAIGTAIQHTLGLDKAVGALHNATGMVNRGVEVSNTGWSAMKTLGSDLRQIAGQFEPLKPIFASQTGLVDLLSNKDNMGRLVGVVSNLFNTSSVLQTLTQAMQGIGEVFSTLVNFFENLLSRIKGRRLADSGSFDYLSLLKNLNFTSIVQTMKFYFNKLLSATGQFEYVKSVLGPLLHKLEGQFQTGGGSPSVIPTASTPPLAISPPSTSTTSVRPTASTTPLAISSPATSTKLPITTISPSTTGAVHRRRGDATVRRLADASVGAGGTGATATATSQHDEYMKALGAIVPTWQDMEIQAIGACPSTFGALQHATTLQCRVAKFVNGYGLSSMVPNIVSQCIYDDQEAPLTCPTKALSADVNNQLLTGASGNALSWVLVALGGLGGAGALGVVGTLLGACSKSSGSGSRSEEERLVE